MGVGQASAGVVVNAPDLGVREINQAIRAGLAAGQPVSVRDPGARHNLGVALLVPGDVAFHGSVGYYCGGMADGPRIRVEGSAGWGVGEGMLAGSIVVDGNAGNSAAASIRGGEVVVLGDCAARAGVAMKGGLLLIGGSAGYMTGFMMQKGVIVIRGDAGDALADSMYEGVIFVGGEIASLGNDAVVEDPSPADQDWLAETLNRHEIPAQARFRKVVSGRKLWNFEKHELETWRAAL